MSTKEYYKLGVKIEDLSHDDLIKAYKELTDDLYKQEEINKSHHCFLGHQTNATSRMEL